MALSNWWQVTTPHRDIVEGRFDEAIFAADLGDVVRSKAPVEYQDGSLFFEKTYLTRGLENLLTAMLGRFSGDEKGESVIQLQTPFGGGKTHALLGLYHLFKNGDDLKHTDVVEYLLGATNQKEVPSVRVAAFVGTHADPLKGKTPWGEIADQLGAYDVVRDHDKKRTATGKDVLAEMLGKSGPSLILLDEILEYIVKANRAEKVEKITHGQTLAFLQELSEVIGTTENSSLVISLPSSALERYDEEAEKALTQLQKIIGRVESVYDPVEGVEIYEVIRKRLFENLGSEKARKEVALWYFTLYHELAEEVPSEVATVDYRERIERAYPFHPELIDVLFERWGSFHTFQRTRGVLRLLAEALGHLYNAKVPSPLVHSSLIPLENPSVRREFVKHIGNEYDSIIAADVAGKGAKSIEIDKQMGSEYKKHNIASGLATAVFLHSFSGGERKGVNLRELRVAILREGIPKTIVGDAVKKLEDELWYFHPTATGYCFKNQANLTRVIVDSEEHVNDEEIRKYLRTAISKLAGRDFEVYLWPMTTSDVPDSRKIKLAMLSPDYTQPGAKCGSFVEELFGKAGSGFRVYKNGLLILALDENSLVSLFHNVKRIIAVESVQANRELLSTLSKTGVSELAQKTKDTKSHLPFLVYSSYQHLAYLTSDGVQWKSLGIPTVGSVSSLSARVKDYLGDEERLLPKISPRVILLHTKLGEKDEKRIGDIYEMYLKTPGLPLPMSLEVLFGGIRRGVSEGAFGIKMDGVVQIGEPVLDIDTEMFVVGKKLAEELKPGYKSLDTEQKKKEEVAEGKGDAPITEGETPSPKTVKSLVVNARIPWERLSSFLSGVIHPLKDKDADLQITIDLKAFSESGFDRTTLDSRVKETLKQIGAQIEIWQED